MKNVDLKVTGSKLTITVDLAQQGGYSKTGRSIVIGSTQGNTPIIFNGDNVYVGLNVYKKV